MKTIKQFSIPFTGLKSGKHQFKFSISDSFFLEFPYSLVKAADVLLEVAFDKQHESMFILHLNFKGQVKLTCQRCLDEYFYPIAHEEKLIVRTVDQNESVDADDSEILSIGKHEHELALSGLIYEYIHLALPLIHQHLQDDSGAPSCNNETSDVLKKLQQVSDEVSNEEPETEMHQLTSHIHSKETIRSDPRWEVLKQLKLDNSAYGTS